MADEGMYMATQMVSLAGQGVGVFVTVTALSARVLLGVLGAAAKGIAHLVHHIRTTGKQSLKNLMRTGEQLDQQEIPDKDVKAIVKQLKKYGVDFSVQKDEAGRTRIFFKADNLMAMKLAMESVIADVARGDVPLDQTPPAQEQQEQQVEPSPPDQPDQAPPPDKAVPEQAILSETAQENREYAKYAQALLAQMKMEEAAEQLPAQTPAEEHGATSHQEHADGKAAPEAPKAEQPSKEKRPSFDEQLASAKAEASMINQAREKEAQRAAARYTAKMRRSGLTR